MGLDIFSGLDKLGRMFCHFNKRDKLCAFFYNVSEHQALAEKGSTQKGKNLLPTGTKFFPFRVATFQKESKTILKDTALRKHAYSNI